MAHDWKASLNRFLNTLFGAKADKVPLFALVLEQMVTRIAGINVRTLFSSPKIYANASIMAHEFLNVDTIALPTVVPSPIEGVAFAETNNRLDTVKWFDYRPVFVEQGEICKTYEDVENLEIPDHNKIKLWKTTFEASKMITQKLKFPQAPGSGIWSVVQQLRGIQAYRDIKENPEILSLLCEKVYQSNLDIYKCWEENVGQIPIIWYLGYAFNDNIMSFEDAMKYEGQYIKRLQKEFKNVPTILHNCGMKPYFKEVCSEIDFIAINGSHPLDINYWIDFKKKYPNTTIMGANIDVSRELFYGTPEDVEEKVKENIFNLAHGGRYMVSPICALPLNIPLPNFFAIRNTIDKYGKYPIKKEK
jgi:uroporphyrinogen-III decarboxylase